MYRWLKRQFIDLTAGASVASEIVDGKKIHGEAGGVTQAGRESDGASISWESACELIQNGPHCLENSLSIRLPSLAKDLWNADLVDMGRTTVVSSWH